MGIKLITGAAAPLVAADVREVCSIDYIDSSFDTQLTEDIAAAVCRLEELSGKIIGAQVWELTLSAFSDEMTLPKGPVTGITSIKYLDVNRTEQTLASSFYIADLVSDPQRVVRDPDATWPHTAADVPNAVIIRFATGFSTAPDKYLKAIRTTVAAWFHNRESAELPPGVIELLDLRGGAWGFA